jgi:type III secretion protein S
MDGRCCCTAWSSPTSEWRAVNQDLVTSLASTALLVCLQVSLPSVVVAALIGLIVSFIGAITSLQDAAIAQGAKFVAVVATLAVTATWGASVVLRFAETAFRTALQ